MQIFDRRQFLQTAGSAVLSASLYSRVVGANERLSMAVIGCGRMGQYNISVMKGTGLADVVAVCDVYEPHLRAGLNIAGRAKAYRDFRRILDDPSIDVVVIAAPDHWHALMTTLACEAGKDVFVEKPASRTIAEGRRMVQVARRTGRIVQVGTMQRSSPVFQNVVKIVQSGALGKVSLVRTWIVSNDYPNGIGIPKDCPPPADLDWDMWLGPAPARPFNWNRFGVGDRWSTFRYFWDYAGGMMTDWGVHLLDIVLWAMKEKAPRAVTAVGGKFCLNDNRETPDTLLVTYQFNDFIAEFSNTEASSRGIDGMGYGIEFCGSQATLICDRGGYRILPQEGGRFDRRTMPEGLPLKFTSGDSGNDAHAENFIDAVKRRTLPISDIEIGHRSTSVSILGNIAYRSGERLVWDAEAERVINSEKANALLDEPYRTPWKLPEA